MALLSAGLRRTRTRQHSKLLRNSPSAQSPLHNIVLACWPSACGSLNFYQFRSSLFYTRNSACRLHVDSLLGRRLRHSDSIKTILFWGAVTQRFCLHMPKFLGHFLLISWHWYNYHFCTCFYVTTLLCLLLLSLR